jgi:hypothetical protein
MRRQYERLNAGPLHATVKTVTEVHADVVGRVASGIVCVEPHFEYRASMYGKGLEPHDTGRGA